MFLLEDGKTGTNLTTHSFSFTESHGYSSLMIYWLFTRTHVLRSLLRGADFPIIAIVSLQRL